MGELSFVLIPHSAVERRIYMLILGGIVLLMGVYLVYAVVHPEKF